MTDASTRVQCPRCKSKSFDLTEVGESMMTWNVKDGRLQRNEGYAEIGSMLYLWAQCTLCQHCWRIRGATQITDVVLEDKDREDISMEDLEDEYRRRRSVDRPWSEYPLGTKALALMGGHWLRVESGWQWQPNGGTFPRPGADAFDVILPKETK